tara:strand:- start:26 stop:418 length:393 start_codon:yes stop_codon:yes gene_type:complete
MKNIQLSTIDFYLKNIIFLFISILIYISTSELVFAKGLDKNINNIKSPEEELAIKYCDAINKNIFNGLNKEELLKYEYFFSSLKIRKLQNPETFYINFKLNVKKNCFYRLNEYDKEEFLSYIKKFLEVNN